MNDWVDIQVNGYAGVDFNDAALTGQALHAACEAMQDDGVAHFLPTIITDAAERMESRLANLVRLIETDTLASRMVVGLHVEGPFLSPQRGYIGAHPAEHAMPANLEITKRLLAAAAGHLRLFTLAPECDPQAQTTRFLADQGVLVSAGHTNASLDDLRRGIDAGLTMFTHLGNGCPIEMHRHDNIVQRALACREDLHFGLIADGHHIPLFALENYLRLIPRERVLLTTDAIAAAGLGPGTYCLAGQQVRVTENDAPRFDDSGQLAGSAATMPMLVSHVGSLGFDADTIDLFCGGNARRLLDLPATA